MELEVYKIDGKKSARKVALDDTIFAVEPNDHAIYLDVKQFLSNRRQGTHSSKERSQMSGSTRKLKKQKGTGGARAGDINSPVFSGGARAFGPHPRVYNFKLNKKVKQLARKSAFSYKAKESQIMIIEDFTFEEVKTKRFKELLSVLNLNEKKVLFIFPEVNENVYLSSRNIPKAKVLIAASINTYEILHANNIVLAEGSVQKIKDMFNNN